MTIKTTTTYTGSINPEFSHDEESIQYGKHDIIQLLVDGHRFTGVKHVNDDYTSFTYYPGWNEEQAVVADMMAYYEIMGDDTDINVLTDYLETLGEIKK